jgi:NAD(P)H dehydrogenase (quinone)
MVKPRILVTSAAGNTGFQTVKQLLENGFPVRALVHRIDWRSDALKALGAEIQAGDLQDIGDVRRALEDVQRAYFCAPLLRDALSASVIFAAAAEERRLEVVVTMSQWLADSRHPSIHTRETWLADKMFSRMPNVGVVTINPGWFADNYMAAMEAIAQFGMLPMPLGEGLNAPPSNEDIARVAVAILTNPASHVGKTYRPTGPALLSPQDIAATFAKVLGRPVKYFDAPLGMFTKVARALGFPDFTVAQILCYLEDYKRGAFALGAPTQAVFDVTGHPPRDVRGHRAALRVRVAVRAPHRRVDVARHERNATDHAHIVAQPFDLCTKPRRPGSPRRTHRRRFGRLACVPLGNQNAPTARGNPRHVISPDSTLFLCLPPLPHC